ncbi:MAG: DDE-type integrase/transposase/recombinase [Mycobacteriaceae bacterium]
MDYIDQYRHVHGVEPICEALKDTSAAIAPSTYYAVKARAPSARAVSDAATLAKVRKVHEDNYGVLGGQEGPCPAAQGRPPGGPVHRGTPHAGQRASGIRRVSRAKSPRTTIPAPAIHRPPDLVGRAFTAPAPNRLWVADITDIRSFSGWVYAAFVLDVFSRRIVGWQVSTSLRTDLALDALEMGIWSRTRQGADLTNLVHHSDRGVQGEFNRSSQHRSDLRSTVRGVSQCRRVP